MEAQPLRVIINNQGTELVSLLPAWLGLSVGDAARRALAEHGLLGVEEIWAVRFNDIFLEWNQRLADVYQALRRMQANPLPLLYLVPRTMLRDLVEPQPLDTAVFLPPGEVAAPSIPPLVPRPQIPVPAFPPHLEAPPVIPQTRVDLPPPNARIPAPLPAPRGAPPTVSRRATVRYYNRMNPERLFPLLVVLSDHAIQEVVKKNVEQRQSDKFDVALDSVVEIEPILPGCECYPPVAKATIQEGRIEVTFWVVPHVLGAINTPRVVIAQNGKKLVEVPLQIKVVKQTATLVMGLSSLVMPYVSEFAQQHKERFVAAQGDGFDPWAWLAEQLLTHVTAPVLGAVLLVLTVLLYLWLRPRKREVFWDIMPLQSGR